MTTETDIDEVIEPGLPPDEELQRLRKSQKSILAKSHERKARIAELETENAALIWSDPVNRWRLWVCCCSLFEDRASSSRGMFIDDRSI